MGQGGIPGPGVRLDVSSLLEWLGVEIPEEAPESGDGLGPVELLGWLSQAGVSGVPARLGRRKLSSLRERRPLVLFDRRRGAHGVLLPGKGEGGGWSYHSFRPGAAPRDPQDALRRSLAYGISCQPAEESGGRADEAGKGRWRRRWFWSVIWEFRHDFLAVLPASFLINAFAVAMPLFIMNVYDRVIPNDAIETLWVLAAGVVIVFTFEFAIRLLRGAFVDHAGKSADRLLAAKIFRQMLALDLGHRPASAGNLASQARSYETVRDFLSAASLVALVDFPFALLMFGVIFWVGGAMGWVPVITASCVILLLLLLQPFLAVLAGKAHQQLINRQSLMAESANGLETIKAANAASGMESYMDEQVEQATRVELQSRRLSQLGSSATVFFINLTTVGIIVAGALLVADQSLSMGGLIACVMIAGRSMAPLNQLSGVLLRLQGVLAALRGLDDLMALPRESDGSEFRSRVRHPEFRLADAALTYPGQPVASLEGLNLAISPGERVGLIGRAGSGKTTLLRLLGRQLLPTTGLVMLDGIDVRQLRPEDVRKACAYLPQDGVLFHGTLRDNIALARPDAPDKAILDAAKVSGVAAWSNRHPSGLNMQVGERGVLLSGGQRQSVLWARCLVAEPDVMLLDEPTSSLDLTAEHQFSVALKHYLSRQPERTLVLATHKLHLLSLVDRVILLDQGKIVADGPREAVLAALREDHQRKAAASRDRAGEDPARNPG